jgi:hypothetical protein
VIGRRPQPPKRPPVGPVPDEHVDPVRAVEAAIRAARTNVRDADKAGNELKARVWRQRCDDLCVERDRLVQVSGVDR